MQHNTHFLISLILIGCHPSGEQSAQTEFRNTLGPENTHLLNDLIAHMETHLHETYGKSKQGNYHLYFTDRSEGITWLKINEKHCGILSRFKDSKLGYQYTRVPYDTLYDNGQEIISVVKEDTNTTTLILQADETYADHIQSIKDSGHLELESRGDLILALESVHGKSEMLDQYLERKAQVDVVNPRLMTEFLLQNLIPVSRDLILKSIILTEIYLQELTEGGC